MVTMQADMEDLQQVVNHIFLPPKLPHAADETSDVAFLDVTLSALASLSSQLLPETDLVPIRHAIALLENMKASMPSGRIEEPEFHKVLLSLAHGQGVAVQVSAQNAAVLITRRAEELVFEAFELSAQDEYVISTKGRLVRTFPGLAVATSVSLLRDSDFSTMVVSTLSTMCTQQVSEMQPKSKKDGKSQDEYRDTTHPAMVTELFMGVLAGIGKYTTVPSILKHTRDEVLWCNAKLPWRRSPTWLLIRVALQLVISRSQDGSRQLYKEIMVFIMSHVLNKCGTLPINMLYIMKSKVQRRLHKLRAATSILPPSVRTFVIRSLTQASESVDAHWKSSQRLDARVLHLDKLNLLDFEQDTLVALPALDKHIEARLSRVQPPSSARYVPLSHLIDFVPHEFPDLRSDGFQDSQYAICNLDRFERWVANHIDQWVVENMSTPDETCTKLHRLITRYYSIADTPYACNPEAVSVLILTVFELWVAIDKVAINACPLLAEFSHGMPVATLQKLLLPFFRQMERFQSVEKYLNHRHANSTRPASDLFATGRQGFANRYFEDSTLHQKLRSKVEIAAAAARQAKAEELQALKAAYADHDSKYRNSDHTLQSVIVDYSCNSQASWNNPRSHRCTQCQPVTEQEHHPYSCQKCSHQRVCDGLSIDVHEWPLPSNDATLKTVVFELEVPIWFSHWRDSRLELLESVLKGKRLPINPPQSYLLSSDDPHLSARYFKQFGQRVTLQSQVKPFIITHYKTKPIGGLVDSDVYVENALKYEYYDQISETRVGGFEYPDVWDCTYFISNNALRRFLFRPSSAPDGPEPNTAISSQSDCPDEMALEEFKDWATLPLGRHIQWPNILLQLAMPSVDFKKPETTLAFLQCIYQAGPPSRSGVLREAHDFFNHDNNTGHLVQELTEALQRIKSNWESCQALSIFVAIASRALSLSQSDAARGMCLSFLSSARTVAMGWVCDLRDKAYAATEPDDRTSFTAKSVEVALICISTCDVDEQFLTTLLAEDNNTSTLIRCSIVVQEGEHSQPASREYCLTLLGMRSKRFLQRAHSTMAQHSDQVDHAVQKSWSRYAAEPTGWTIVSGAGGHWLSTDTLVEGHSMSVHLDLLSGELLVNGLPMDQPSKSCREQPLYATLFDRALVEVMPCTAPGFQFSTKRTFGGYEVCLGIAQAELLVSATKSGVTYETIPTSLLQAAFPVHFSQDFVHWFNTATKTIQFRPAGQPWDETSPNNWTLSTQPGSTKWKLARGTRSVIGVAAATSKQVSDILEPLADTSRIHNVLQSTGGKLLIEIPTLDLSFHLIRGSSLLISEEYPHMVVDNDQTLGTFIGLRSKLLLKHQQSGSRMVLIPESDDVHFALESGRIKVAVTKNSISKVHAVVIDPLLGRLLDTGELSCRLYLAYLHALTSFCLVDPLTRRTGTEQALAVLSSAAVKSFDQLSQACAKILAKFAELTPVREYYPKHKCVMQTVRLNNQISFLSQHGHFMSAVQTLLQQSEQTKILFPGKAVQLPDLRKTDRHLLQRDNIRSATFRVSGFGADDHTIEHDAAYTARDHDSTSQRAVRAASMSNLLSRDAVAFADPVPGEDHLWQKMCALGPGELVSGPSSPMGKKMLRYDARLLREGFADALQKLPPLHRWLGDQLNRTSHKFSMAVWLSTVAFAEDADIAILQALAMFFRSSAFMYITPPDLPEFRPSAGKTHSRSSLHNLVTQSRHDISLCPEYNLPGIRNEDSRTYTMRCDAAWRRASELVIGNFVDELVSQWPIECPSTPNVRDQATYIDIPKAMSSVTGMFKPWHDNFLLNKYLDSLRHAMCTLPILRAQLSVSVLSIPPTSPRFSGHVTEHDVFQSPPPQLSTASPRCSPGQLEQEPDRLSAPLLQLVPQLPTASPRCSPGQLQQDPDGRSAPLLQPVRDRLVESAESKYEREYAAFLSTSLDALFARGPVSSPCDIPELNVLMDHLNQCEQHFQKISHAIHGALGPSQISVTAGYLDQWPRLSPTLFLQQLAHKRWIKLPVEWKPWILQYGLALTAFQRAKRLCTLFDTSRQEDFFNQLQNSGHQNWDPNSHPETLLMEIESDILIRPVQEQIAAKMRAPDGDNLVMQLNMGEGKSSCIVPMVASTLADGKKLVRVIVAKPQSQQMAQMLISKLGGLLDRRVYYMPISRSLKLDSSQARTIWGILQDCMNNGGVLLVQPEHILSLQLMALECYISGGREDVGRELMLTLDFLDQHARDIVDESDENFSVKFELIYTLGTQRPIELSPDRWLLMQEVLDLVRTLSTAIAEEHPSSFEYHQGAPGSFPRVRILNPDAGALLMHALATRICAYGLDGFQISRQPAEIREAVFTYITKLELDDTEVEAVERSPFWIETTKSSLLLIRGLIACGVLQFTLGQKRWRVQYGLATTRRPPTKLAVPYRAKDSPSPRSEFSHPEVIIILTLLSYYYEGLTDEDLFTAMGHLVDSDQSDIEYQAWVRDAPGLPIAFKQLQGINLKDRPQCISEVFPELRYAKSVVDYFLARIVFPEEMKEFPFKLSASGWDLGKHKTLPVTGFSGTNDSRCLLPVTVQQLDIPEQAHTNALVLNHIMQPENSVVLMESAAPGVSDAQHLLDTVLNLEPPVEVILDVGAQILELVNVAVARTWLSKHPTKLAAVFVNDSDELSVVDRDGRIDTLRSSSFFTRLDTCLIFLDEAHTRGIDLVLPTSYRAAVTLGAGLIKDRLVQACMRMRKLGKGQTVVFCISPEIQTKIADCKTTLTDKAAGIAVADVILWSIAEMHTEVRRSMPLWARQGERYVRQEQLLQQMRHDGRTTLTKDHAEKFQEEEAQAINVRYRSCQVQGSAKASSPNPSLQLISERCKQFDDLQFDSSTLQEEQERELSPEVEQERQVQRAAPAKPLPHSMHRDVKMFADSGTFIADSEAYMPAFEALQASSAAKFFPIAQLVKNAKLFATADFAKTVEQSASYLSDGFSRSVQWVLTNRVEGNDAVAVDRMLIISHYEANEIYTSMRKSRAATLHLYKPRINSGYATLDRLDFHTVSGSLFKSSPTVPRALAVQLNLFAGQLYISSYEDYLEICNFLGLSSQTLTGDLGWKLSADGFILSDNHGRVGGASGLKQSPVNFFKILFSKIRRNGEGIAKTHMGSLLEGKLFQSSEWDSETTG
jgi:hypothetical protein